MTKYYVLIFATSLLLSCKRSNTNVEFKIPEIEPEIVENKTIHQKQEVVELSYKNLSSIQEFEVADENLRRWKNYMNKILDSCYRNYDDVIDEAAEEYTLTEEEVITLKKKYHNHLENSQKNWSNYVKDMIELEYKYEIPGYIGSGTDFAMLKTEIEYVKKRVEELKGFIVIIGGSA
jgi:hypothetical protein